MTRLSLCKSVALMAVCLCASPSAADQPKVGSWAKPVAAALAGAQGGRGEAQVFGRVEAVDVVLEDGSWLELRWSSSAAEFMADLKAHEARARPVGEGYDVATGLNRYVQNLGRRGFAATEHWMDYGGTMRRATVYAPTRDDALNWLLTFETYRRAGGFGGSPVTTPPQPSGR